MDVLCIYSMSSNVKISSKRNIKFIFNVFFVRLNFPQPSLNPSLVANAEISTSWTCLWDAVDSDLLAEHFLWASTDPKAKNQAFNVNNGDVFKWKHMWNVLAREFEIEAVGFVGKEPVLLEDLMKDKDSVWDEIVKKHDLSPTRLRDIAAFWLADVVFRNKETLCSMNKNKEFGFLGFRDTTKSFVNSIRKMRDFRFIP